MLFSSIIFILFFLPFVLAGNFVCQKIGGNKWANILLLIASLFFYAWGKPNDVYLLIASIFINWGAGILISSWKKKKLILTLTIIVNLLFLGIFKYAAMLVTTINDITGLTLHQSNISLPIGISFFTFQALSYIIDVYRKQCPPQKNIINLGLYISFFPQLIAGPIVKYNHIEEQITKRKITVDKFAEGIRRFLYGFGKKVLIANTLAFSVDNIYNINFNDISFYILLIASLMYTFQIYYDFSGYSDMAIGLGKMFGFEFAENFNYPYISRSISEFWRRWHISLGSWFKQYLYIPLGGNRKGELRTCINLAVVFFLTGLWHGASWSFVLWGMFHGGAVITERLGLARILEKHKYAAWFYCFFFVNITWILFRVDNISSAFSYTKMLFFPWEYTKSEYSIWYFIDYYTLFIFVCAILGMGFMKNIKIVEKFTDYYRGSVIEIIFLMFVFFMSLLNLASSTYNPFIYFRF